MHEIKNYNDKIPFFDPIVQDNFPFIAQDFDSLTLYEKYAKIVGYLNAVIKKTDLTSEQMEKLVKLQDELTNYVNNYFDNLDVQNEINNKLDEMITDGTFDSIINDRLFNDLKSQIQSLNTELNKRLRYYKVTPETPEDDILSLLAINEAKIIEFEHGTYNFTKRIIVNKNTTLLFNHSTINTSFVDQYGDPVALLNYQLTDEFLGYKGNGNISFYDGIFNFCFAFMHGTNINIVNCEWKNPGCGHCIQIMACNNFNIESCVFNGVKMQTGDYYKYECINIDECVYAGQPYSNPDNPTFDGTINRNLKINNCIFNEGDLINSKLYTAIGSHGVTANTVALDNLIISNNKIINSHYSFLNTAGYSNVKILNNESSQNRTNDLAEGTAHFMCRATNKNYIVSNNKFTGGFEWIHKSGATEYFENWNINNNIIEDITNTYRECIISHFTKVKNFTINANIFNKIGETLLATNKEVDNLVVSNNYYSTENIDSSRSFVSLYGDTNSKIINNVIQINTNQVRAIRIDKTKSFNYEVIGNSYNNPNYFTLPEAVNNKFHNNEGLYRVAWPQSNSVNNRDFEIPITNMKKLILMIGSSTAQNNIEILPWIDNGSYFKLDSDNRRFKFKVFDDNGSDTLSTFEYHRDGTYSYSGTLPLRYIYGQN